MKLWLDLHRKGDGESAGRPPEAPSASVGKYQLIERIGSGGFGTVFKAWDPDIKRPVAIKTCTLGKELQGRFFQEAELAGRLHHPNITTVYEFGMEGETPYIVQEFLSGEDLSQIIARRDPLDVHARVKILLGIALGLEYAHRSGVMHRDIKPANVRILENRTVKIMDFGVAKVIGAPSVLTGTGVAVGSSSYMSPEQVCGDRVDLRTDVFSLGVLAYELFSYRKPFENENLFRLLEMIVKEEPEPIAHAAPDIPEALAVLIERAMRKDPVERFESMKELRLAIAAAHRGEAAPARSTAVPAVPDSESQRLAALERQAGDGAISGSDFDDLARLASQPARVHLHDRARPAAPPRGGGGDVGRHASGDRLLRAHDSRTRRPRDSRRRGRRAVRGEPARDGRSAHSVLCRGPASDVGRFCDRYALRPGPETARSLGEAARRPAHAGAAGHGADRARTPPPGGAGDLGREAAPRGRGALRAGVAAGG